MDLELKTHYWDDPRARRAFKKFILGIHGLDFSEWESGGYWDEDYTPFSFFDGESIVASVCIYLLDAIIGGEPTRLVQISGVGTLPEWRRRGLSRQLTEIGLDWAKGRHRGVFLFADADAVSYYERCGFRAIDEFVEVIDVTPVPTCPGVIKLDPGRPEHRERIHAYATRRAPISDNLSVLSSKLLMFHALYTLREHAYEIPDLDCIVFFKREGACLSVFDIVGAAVPSLEALYPYIASDGDRSIEFHFHADKLGIGKARSRRLVGNNPFVGVDFLVEEPVFPFTSRA